MTIVQQVRTIERKKSICQEVSVATFRKEKGK